MKYLLLIFPIMMLFLAGCKSPTQPGASIQDEINAARPISSVTVNLPSGTKTFNNPGVMTDAYATGGFLVVKGYGTLVYSFSLTTTTEVDVSGHLVTLDY